MNEYFLFFFIFIQFVLRANVEEKRNCVLTIEPPPSSLRSLFSLVLNTHTQKKKRK